MEGSDLRKMKTGNLVHSGLQHLQSANTVLTEGALRREVPSMVMGSSQIAQLDLIPLVSTPLLQQTLHRHSHVGQKTAMVKKTQLFPHLKILVIEIVMAVEKYCVHWKEIWDSKWKCD